MRGVGRKARKFALWECCSCIHPHRDNPAHEALQSLKDHVTAPCAGGGSGWISGRISSKPWLSGALVVLTGRLALPIPLFQPERLCGREAAARSRDAPTVPALNAPQALRPRGPHFPECRGNSSSRESSRTEVSRRGPEVPLLWSPGCAEPLPRPWRRPTPKPCRTSRPW